MKFAAKVKDPRLWRRAKFCWFPEYRHGETYWLERPPFERRMVKCRAQKTWAVCWWQERYIGETEIIASFTTKENWSPRRHGPIERETFKRKES